MVPQCARRGTDWQLRRVRCGAKLQVEDLFYAVTTADCTLLRPGWKRCGPAAWRRRRWFRRRYAGRRRFWRRLARRWLWRRRFRGRRVPGRLRRRRLCRRVPGRFRRWGLFPRGLLWRLPRRLLPQRLLLWRLLPLWLWLWLRLSLFGFRLWPRLLA